MFLFKNVIQVRVDRKVYYYELTESELSNIGELVGEILKDFENELSGNKHIYMEEQGVFTIESFGGEDCLCCGS